jgi:RecA-family ATPase/5S rRNA maturation endonuclease (ribonuclease M5)
VADHSGGIHDLQSLARALGGVVSGKEVLAPGPGHSAKDRSLSVTLDPNAPDGFIVNSFAGDDPIRCKDFVREKAGLPAFNGGRKPKPKFNIHKFTNTQKTSAEQKSKVVATYAYTDDKGELLYEVVRLEPKSFRQRRPKGNGAWTWNVDGCRRVPYRLQDLLKYPDACVFVCEGEKDADRVASLDHCATTVACGDWTEDCITPLAGRDVLILEDNDDAGRKKALEAAQALHGKAKTIRIVRLPGLPEKGDVSDWLDADLRNASKLVNVCFEAPLWTPDTPTPAPSPPLAVLQWIDMSNWDREPMPERQWAIHDRVPLNQAGLLSGEGGAGKSIIELTKNVAHVAGKDWFRSMPEKGPAVYVGSEDDETEIHIRLANIVKHYGVTFEQLIAGGLHVLCLLGQDAVLCASYGKSGKVEVTDLYRRLYEAAGDIKPKNISIDTLSRAFAGNEIDRVQVYAFAMHMQALAMVAGGSVTVLSHPSLQGIASGSGISGSTAWHGAFRFRQYLTSVKPENGEQPDDDLRELQFKKNQYGPKAETVVARYQRGLFLPVPGVGSLEKMAQNQKDDELFLTMLDQFERQGRPVSDKPNANNYAPALFSKDLRANGTSKTRLADAMNRLFGANKIRVASYGPPSRTWTKLTPS